MSDVPVSDRPWIPLGGSWSFAPDPIFEGVYNLYREGVGVCGRTAWREEDARALSVEIRTEALHQAVILAEALDAKSKECIAEIMAGRASVDDLSPGEREQFCTTGGAGFASAFLASQIRGLSNEIAGKPCEHEWVSADNSTISNGVLCLKCGAIREADKLAATGVAIRGYKPAA